MEKKLETTILDYIIIGYILGFESVTTSWLGLGFRV